MPELTPDEKQKIYEEEKARKEATKKLEKEEKAKKTKKGCLGCLGVFVIFFLFVIIMSKIGGDGQSPTPPTQKKSEQITLNAQVNYNKGSFKVTNNDTFDWRGIKFEVNSSGLKSGYIYKTDLMVAGEYYTIPSGSFAKKDGTIFNPYTMKPLNLSIWCDVPNGKGFYFGEWGN